MRSETAPMWTAFLIGLGVMLIIAAFMVMATGKLKLTRDTTLTREENTGAFWAWVGGMILVGIISIAIATPHFGPGG